MARLALATGGAIAGGLIGGPLGAQLGFAAGAIAGNILFPPPGTTITGPRLGDTKVTSSAYGKPIPLLHGVDRVGGNVTWSLPIQEVRREEDVGGKGGPSVTTVSFSYFGTFRVNFCVGPGQGVLRIWADGKLLADWRGTTPIFNLELINRPRGFRQILSGADVDDLANQLVRVYLGAEDQLPDPSEQADRGIDNTPAYRGQVSIVFEDLPLEDYGNRLPQITAEIAISASDPHPVLEVTPVLANTFAQLSALWSADYTNFIILNDFDVNNQEMTRWDSINKVEIWTLDLAGEGFHGSALDNENNAYLVNEFTGVISKIDYASGQIVLTSNAADFVANDVGMDIIVGGVPPLQTVFIVDALRNVGFFDAGTLSLIDAYDFETRVPPFSPATGFALTDGLAVDGDGFIWIGLVDGIDGYLAKFNPASGSVDDLIVLAGENMTFLTYVPENNSLVYQGGALPVGVFKRFNIDSGAIDATLTLSGAMDLGQFNWSQFRNGPIDGVIWLAGGTKRYEIDLLNMVEIRVVDSTDWTFTNGFDKGGIYDPIHHAIISRSSNPPDAVWMFLDRLVGAPVLLKDIVDAVSTEVGLTPGVDTDTTALTDPVIGYLVPSRIAARSPIEELARVYDFVAREEDFAVEYVKNGGSAVFAVTADDVGAAAGTRGETIPVSPARDKELDLPRVVDLTYADQAIDYQPNLQRFQLPSEAVVTERELTVTTAAVLANQEAAERVNVIGYRAWIERSSLETTVGLKHARPSPGDVGTVDDGTTVYQVRLTDTDLGGNGIIRLESVFQDEIISIGAGAGVDPSGVPTPPIGLPGATSLYVFDRPLLRDQDEGLRIHIATGAQGPQAWPGAQVLKSLEGLDYFPETFFDSTRNATHGFTTTALGAPATSWTWDRVNTVTLKLFRGSLSSITELQALNLGNAILIGNEYLHFVNATLNADGSYTLDTLIRGRRGTEGANSSHAAGERVVLLSANTVLAPFMDSGELNLQRWWKAVTLGSSLAGGTIKTLTYTGATLKPYAPVHIKGTREGSPQDWSITWQRRTRLAGAWKDGTDVPLAEESEAYEVDITIPTGTRTITAIASAGGSVVIPATKTCIYSEADQTTDFGGPASSFPACIYQLSATVGRGFAGCTTIAEPDTLFADVSLLLPFDGTDGATTTTDRSAYGHTVTFSGASVEIDTAQSKWGTSSLRFFANDGSKLTIADHASLEVGNKPYTIEFWIRWSAEPGDSSFVRKGNGSPNHSYITDYTASNNRWFNRISTDGVNITGSTFGALLLTNDTWYHVAFERDLNDLLTVYHNGAVTASTSSGSPTQTLHNHAQVLQIGAFATNNDVWIDDLRITIGAARYGGAFTPPTGPHPIP